MQVDAKRRVTAPYAALERDSMYRVRVGRSKAQKRRERPGPCLTLFSAAMPVQQQQGTGQVSVYDLVRALRR